MTEQPTNRAFEAASDDQRLLDLLVDNELSLAERRELLGRLDEQPDGWRRCALAFLEAQAWQTELPEVTRAAAEPMPGESEPGPRRGGSLGWSNYLSLAASFLLAFGLGLWMRGAGTTPANPQPSNPGVAQTQAGGNAQLASDGLAGALTVPGSEQPVPVYVGSGYDEQWLRNQPSAVPPSLLESLEQMGHVRQNRQLVPVDLEDGRRVIVPVDQVDVQFTGGRPYQ